MAEGDAELTTDEFVEYCETQARLLWGQVDTMEDELDDLLSELDAEMADLRERLGEHTDTVEGTVTPGTDDGADLDDIEEIEADLEERQTVAAAKQARMTAFRELAVGYAELATDLDDAAEGRAALKRVLEFEQEHDAPAYFPERQTVLEAAAADDESEESG
ncbi:hypothetical protein [Halorientalis regularis]|jgi:ABC-type transporter Mla subunit MlaD|uniref:Uncharacterized protein n=1 Tax=Halorientalis regularis TaxID=660518 RepID=A0A1G7JSI7_9EURY|nr:hypothetical protein [Halorientalis regularis]SDF27927.1 hypothetical protein SAMN05216218_10549 [Halorientalis regularis]